MLNLYSEMSVYKKQKLHIPVKQTYGSASRDLPCYSVLTN